MYIARILYPVKVLGPGKRIGIWFDGCSHFCKGCSNPELWEQDEKYITDLEQVMQLVRSIADQYEIDGFTITGGDPMEQPEALKELLPELRRVSGDILLYTGYKYEEIKHKYSDILKNVSVLIDGPYIEDLNTEELMKGSTNQKIMILDDTYKERYDQYMKTHNSEVQNFTTPTGTISVGIHRPGYEQELDLLLKKKGLSRDE